MGSDASAGAVLARRLAAGDVSALAELYDAYSRQLYAYARSLGADELLAEDVLHEVFVRMIRRPPEAPAVRSMRSYLYAATRNEFFRWGTRLAHRREVEGTELSGLFEADSGSRPPEEALAVEEALSALPEAQREVVMMKIYGGLTFEEIAETLDISINTAASRYRYALEKLKIAFGEA
jgi:RNA polymerase sigma-70 factor (ECF subfamily)